MDEQASNALKRPPPRDERLAAELLKSSTLFTNVLTVAGVFDLLVLPTVFFVVLPPDTRVIAIGAAVVSSLGIIIGSFFLRGRLKAMRTLTTHGFATMGPARDINRANNMVFFTVDFRDSAGTARAARFAMQGSGAPLQMKDGDEVLVLSSPDVPNLVVAYFERYGLVVTNKV